jgi:hypothetical protein
MGDDGALVPIVFRPKNWGGAHGAPGPAGPRPRQLAAGVWSPEWVGGESGRGPGCYWLGACYPGAPIRLVLVPLVAVWAALIAPAGVWCSGL